MTATPSVVPTHLVLSAAHQSKLAKYAVPVEVALEAGVRTVSTADDLPDELAHCAAQVPGILFAHRTMAGRVVHQYCPDVPADPDHKYLFPVGVGSVLSVHPRMADRVGTATRVLVVEGTKQQLAVVANAPADLLVIGIQGAQAWSRDGVPMTELDRLAVTAAGEPREVTIWFDADWTAKLEVWSAAERLGAHLRTVGASNVRYVRMPAGAKAGADDYLAGRDAATRPGVVASLIEQATDRLGRKPKAKVRATTTGQRDRLVVDWVMGQVREPATERDGVTVPGSVVADFALRIRSSSEVIDDLNLDARVGSFAGVDHTLEIAVGTGETRQEWVIPNVSDVELAGGRNVNSKAAITAILARVPGGEGTRLWWKTSAADQIIAAARGASADAPTSVTALRTGWHQRDGVWGYLHNGGFVTANGQSDACRSSLPGSAGKVWFTAAEPVGSQQLRDDVATVVALLDQVNDVGPVAVLEGAGTYTLTGAPPEMGVYCHGQPGSGKTTLVWAWQARFGVELHDRAMYSPNSTVGALGAVGAGLHHAAVVVDDVTTGSMTPKELEARVAAIDALARRSYGGGSVGRQRLARNETGIGRGSYAHEAPDEASPLVVLSGEFLPPATMESLVQRLLAVELTYGGSFKGKEAVAAFEGAASSGAMNRATGGFIRWVATEVERMGGHEAYVAIVERLRVSFAEKLAREFPETLGAEGVHSRARMVPAGAIAGWALWLKFARACGAIGSDEQVKELARRGYEAIAKLAERQVVELSVDTSPSAVILARLRELVAGGSAQFYDDRSDNVTAVVIGRKLVRPRNLPGGHVALLPGQVAKALGGGVTASDVRARLADVASATHHNVRVGDEIPQAILVPYEVWARVDAATIENDDPAPREEY